MDLEEVLKQAHFTNLSVRRNGKWETYEGDVVRHLLTLQSMLCQTEEMNGEDAFWHHMARLPISKFNGPMRKALQSTKAFALTVTPTTEPEA